MPDFKLRSRQEYEKELERIIVQRTELLKKGKREQAFKLDEQYDILVEEYMSLQAPENDGN